MSDTFGDSVYWTDAGRSYAISFYWFGHRFCWVRKMMHERALWMGRHLWRLRYLGARHVQIEDGTFPTSPIRTLGEPATRAADVWSIPWSHGFSRNSHDGVRPEDTFTRPTPAAKRNKDGSWVDVPPNVLRQGHYVPAAPDLPMMLLESSRTNYALYSEGKP